MRLTIEQAQFLKGLQAVERAVNDRSTLPILANVLLEAKESALILTATDLDVGVQCRLPLLQPAEQGAVTLPAKRLTTIVRELPGEPVTLEAKKNHTATLACGPSQFRLQGLPPEDFPIFPPVERATTLTISQAGLRTLVTHTMFAMSLEETRFILNGALLTATDRTLTVVATDGRRLAVADEPLLSTGHGPQPLGVVPSKTVRELGRLLSPSEEDDSPVQIMSLKGNQLLFQFRDVTILTRLIDGQFPNYESVIPPASPATMVCNRTLLMSAVRRASLMTTATSQAVLFELAKDRLVVSKESSEVGSAREELPARYTGEAMAVAFNPEFWLDALKMLDVEELTIELSAPEKPAVVRLPHFLYIVLPMKLA